MRHLTIILSMAFLAAGCARPRQVTCPTDLVACPCAELELQEPPKEVEELIASLRGISGERLQVPSRAAEALAARCREEGSPFPPPPERRDDQWRQRCSSAEIALPALLETLGVIEARRGPGGESTPEESSLADSVVSALGNITLGNPETPCRPDVIRALIEVAGTPEPALDLSVADTAVRLLGALGPPEAAPVLVRVMFRQSRRRSLSLLEPARTALMQSRDLAAAAEALVRAGRLEDPELREALEADPRLDVRHVKEQVAVTLGRLALSSPVVTEYLMAELRHDGLDELDRLPVAEGERLTPEQVRGWRRAAAARALGRMRHEPALDVILGRLSMDNQAGRLVDPTVDILEVPSYLDAVGFFLMPDQTDTVLLDWVVYGRDITRDRAARALSLQGGAEHAARLAEVTESLDPCPPGGGRCIRRNFEERYLPALRSAAGCTSVACWQGRLTAEGTTDPVRERAAYQVAMLAYGDGAASAAARDALISALEAGAEGETFEALIFAIDRLSPEGCAETCQDRLAAYIDERREAATYSGAVRSVTGLLGRLRDRAR